MDLAQVEVIKGVASALYGASALGGVVNLISRRPQRDKPEREVLVNRTSRGGTDSVVWLSKRGEGNWGYTFLGGGHWQERNDIDRDGWTDLPTYRRAIVRPRLMWDDGSGRSVFFTIGAMAEDRKGGTQPGAAAPDGNPFPENLATRRFDAGIVATLPLGTRTVLTVRSSALGQWHRHQFGQATENDLHHTWFGEAALTSKRRNTPGCSVLRCSATSIARGSSAVSTTHRSCPVSSRRTITRPRRGSRCRGARIDHHNTFGTFVSPRISGLLKHASTGLTFRLSTGTGFFAPTPFIEETEATGLSELAPLGDLEAERGRSISADLGWKRGPLELNATLFGSAVAHPLQLHEHVLSNARDSVRTRGSELIARFHVETMDLIATHMFVWSTEPEPGTRPQTRSPAQSASYGRASTGCGTSKTR